MTRPRVDDQAFFDLRQREAARNPRLHWCEARGCREWGSYSDDHGHSWWCREHRPNPAGWPQARSREGP